MSAKSRSRSDSNEQQIEIMQAQPPQQIQLPELPPEQKEFLDTLNKLVISGQKVTTALALLPEEVFTKCPDVKELIQSAREVTKAIKKFQELVDKRLSS